ncbi:AhpC/TSA family protein, partial [Acinetobacter baumannii]
MNHAVELGSAAEEIAGLGFRVVVVGHGSAQDAEKIRARKNLPFAVLADPTHDAFDAFDLGKVLGYWQKSGAFVL